MLYQLRNLKLNGENCQNGIFKILSMFPKSLVIIYFPIHGNCSFCLEFCLFNKPEAELNKVDSP